MLTLPSSKTSGSSGDDDGADGTAEVAFRHHPLKALRSIISV